MFCLDVETTLKMGCFLDVEIQYVVSTLKIGCSMSRPKINVKTFNIIIKWSFSIGHFNYVNINCKSDFLKLSWSVHM